MKYICLADLDKKGLETKSEIEQNAVIDECFAFSDVPRTNRHLVGGEALQTARNATILRCKKGLAEQRLRTARHAMEFAAWQASGGDFLRSGMANAVNKQ